jgi:hypothetical protein
MQTTSASPSSHLLRNLTAVAAFVGFGVLAVVALGQRCALHRMENRVAVLEQQNLRLLASVQTLEATAAEADQAEIEDPFEASSGDDRDILRPSFGSVNAHDILMPSFGSEEADDSEDSASTDDEMEDLVATGEALYVHGEYDAAARVVEPATRVEATATRAWRVLGACACFQHDAKNAKRANAKLDAKNQKFVTYVCAKNDITL